MASIFAEENSGILIQWDLNYGHSKTSNIWKLDNLMSNTYYNGKKCTCWVGSFKYQMQRSSLWLICAFLFWFCSIVLKPELLCPVFNYFSVWTQDIFFIRLGYSFDSVLLFDTFTNHWGSIFKLPTKGCDDSEYYLGRWIQKTQTYTTPL